MLASLGRIPQPVPITEAVAPPAKRRLGRLAGIVVATAAVLAAVAALVLSVR
jgi:hypothetical protein